MTPNENLFVEFAVLGLLSSTPTAVDNIRLMARKPNVVSLNHPLAG